MSSDEPSSRRNRITRNLRVAYDEIAAEPIPVMFERLLRRLGGDDDDLDPGIAAEPPQRPKGGPKSGAAAVSPQRTDD